MDELRALADVYKLPPQAFLQGLGAVERTRQNDMATLQQQFQANEFAQQANPMRLQALQQGIDQHNAQLPGMFADTQLKQDAARKSRETLPGTIEETNRGFDEKRSADNFKRLTNVVQAYGQAGGMLSQVPPAARHAYARQVLGENYRPEIFDQVPPEQLPKMLGKMSEEGSKYAQKAQLEAQKQAFLMQRDEAKAASAARIAQFKASIVTARTDAAKRGPNSLNAFAAQLRAAAMNESDPDRAEALRDEANIIVQQMSAAAIATATARSAGGIDPGAATGMATKPVPAPVGFADKKAAPGSSSDNPIILK